MEPSWTACMPSKCRLTPRATSSGRGPPAGSPPATGLRATTSVSTGTGLFQDACRFGGSEDAPALRDAPARPEPQEAEDQAPDAPPFDRRDQAGRAERR